MSTSAASRTVITGASSMGTKAVVTIRVPILIGALRLVMIARLSNPARAFRMNIDATTNTPARVKRFCRFIAFVSNSN